MNSLSRQDAVRELNYIYRLMVFVIKETICIFLSIELICFYLLLELYRSTGLSFTKQIICQP